MTEILSVVYVINFFFFLYMYSLFLVSPFLSFPGSFFFPILPLTSPLPNILSFPYSFSFSCLPPFPVISFPHLSFFFPVCPFYLILPHILCLDFSPAANHAHSQQVQPGPGPANGSVRQCYREGVQGLQGGGAYLHIGPETSPPILSVTSCLSVHHLLLP